MGQNTSRQKHQSMPNSTNISNHTLSVHEILLKNNTCNNDETINYHELINAIKKANKVEIKLYY
jgi:hypothetical protein